MEHNKVEAVATSVTICDTKATTEKLRLGVYRIILLSLKQQALACKDWTTSSKAHAPRTQTKPIEVEKQKHIDKTKDITEWSMEGELYSMVAETLQ